MPGGGLLRCGVPGGGRECVRPSEEQGTGMTVQSE